MDGWITQLRKGLLDFCILNVLRQGESYGYEIVQKLKRVEELAVSESTVYPILARLRAEGLLKVRDVPSPAGPPRRYFALTVTGKLRIAEMNAYWDLLGQALTHLRQHDSAGKDHAS
jgi:PadR family transcriptional regulator PadR